MSLNLTVFAYLVSLVIRTLVLAMSSSEQRLQQGSGRAADAHAVPPRSIAGSCFLADV
jgi:hypothetical protein